MAVAPLLDQVLDLAAEAVVEVAVLVKLLTTLLGFMLVVLVLDQKHNLIHRQVMVLEMVADFLL